MIMLVIAFAGGITIFRQTHAIWDMESSNAVTINNTLNSFTSLEPLLVIVILVGIIVAWCSVTKGFGES